MKQRIVAALLALVFCFAGFAAAEESEKQPPAFPEFESEVVFGRYEQDENYDNGPEPIEWLVLEVKGTKVFLLSKYCLETRIFNEYPAHSPCYWGKSKIRTWMNEDFLNAAFTASEQEMIQLTTVENHNPHGMRGGGEDTLDKIYFLSRNEALQYMPEMEDRIAYPTAHAIATGCEVNDKNGACYWWLRTPGARNVDIQGVRPTGRIAAYGKQDVWWKTNTVRPCMWVDIYAFEDQLPEGWVPEEVVVEEEKIVRCESFYTFDLFTQDYEKFSAMDVPWLKCEVLGYSVEGRPLYAYTLGTGDVYVLIFAGIHGNEIANTPMVMDGFAELVDRMEDGDPEVASRLENVTMVFVPCANPDGYDYCMGYALNNILMTRKVNASEVNLNRNFPDPHWGNADAEEGENAYPGPAAGSEPETQALVELAKRHPYSAMLDFHSKAQEVYYGKGGFRQEDILTGFPVERLNEMTKELAEAICPTRYRLRLQADAASESGFGSSTDFLFHLGVPAVTVETIEYVKNEAYSPSMIRKEAQRIQFPQLFMNLCDIAMEFDKELHP